MKFNIILLWIKSLFNFTFCVTYSTFILYSTDSLGITPSYAAELLAAVIAYSFLVRCLACSIVGIFFSYRTVLLISMILSAIGCILTSVNSLLFVYWGLTCVALGNGLSITTHYIIAKKFQLNYLKRESAFIVNYSVMNIGWIVGLLICGYFQLSQDYQKLFMLGSIGSFLSIIIVIMNWDNLSDKNILPESDLKKNNNPMFGSFMLLALAFFIVKWLSVPGASTKIIFSITAITALGLIIFIIQQSCQETRKKIFFSLGLLMVSLIFWTLYHLTPLTLLLFFEKNVDRSYAGMIIPPQWLQMFNAISIILFGSLLNYGIKQYRKKIELFPLLTFIMLSLVMMGISFILLALGIYFCNENNQLDLYWIILSLILQGTGELLIMPIGLALIGEMIPARFQNVMISMWFLSIGTGAILSSFLSGDLLRHFSELTSLSEINILFFKHFSSMGAYAIVLGLLALIGATLTKNTSIRTNVSVA